MEKYSRERREKLGKIAGKASDQKDLGLMVAATAS